MAVITQDRVMDDNLKRQTKNQTLCSCKLFLLTYGFQYTSNWPKVVQLLPTLFVQYTLTYLASQGINFFMVNNFSVYQVGLYINWTNTFLFIILGKLPTLNLPIKSHPLLKQLFSGVFLVSNYHGCKRDNIINNKPIDKYYSQNCKAITFRKITNLIKYEKCSKSTFYFLAEF